MFESINADARRDAILNESHTKSSLCESSAQVSQLKKKKNYENILLETVILQFLMGPY